MHILVTGGTGFIGAHLIRALAGHTITALTRDKIKASKLITQSNVNFIQSLDELTDLNHIDVVINLAGEPISQRWNQSNKIKITQSRLDTTQKIVELIKQSHNPPSCLISGSAIGIYGDQGAKLVDEHTANTHLTNGKILERQEGGFTQQLCEKWESIAMQAQSVQTRVCLIRTGIALGFDTQNKPAGILKVLLPVFKLGAGGRVGSGKQYMAWIHITDIVNAIVFLIEAPQAKGAFNLCAPSAVTNQQFGQELAKILNRPFLCHVPTWIIRLILGEASALALDSVNAKPTQLERLGFKFSYLNIKDALLSINK